MGYRHIDIISRQLSMKPGAPCGDLVACERTPQITTILVCDGLGHGIKAHVAAQMCVSRLMELLRKGHSLRKAFSRIVKTMEESRGSDMPYAVVTAARILSDGMTTILGYEMPPPVFINPEYCQVLPQRSIEADQPLIRESNCYIEPGEGVVLMSDGITQAGIGAGLLHGWAAAGAGHFMQDCLVSGSPMDSLPGLVLNQARVLCRNTAGDDCTVMLALCRQGRTVTILTGPPADPGSDKALIRRFLSMEGTRVVCGGTTSRIAARVMGKEVSLEENSQSLLAPPIYRIEGLDLVTEGAVTLNQVYNVFDADPELFREENSVTELCRLLREADRINLLIGSAMNPASGDISFRQKGIMTRQAIVPHLAEKLRQAGKLVVEEYI